MACVNKSLPAFKELAKQYGENLAESIVIGNKGEIPTVEQATNIIRGTNVRNYKKAIRYIQTTTSAAVDDLVKNFGRIIQQVGDKYYVIKGSKIGEPNRPMAVKEIEESNISFLREMNNEFGNIFQIASTDAVTESDNSSLQDALKVLSENKDDLKGIYKEFATSAPELLLDEVAKQALGLTDTGELHVPSEADLARYGRTTEQYAADLVVNTNKAFGEPITKAAVDYYNSKKQQKQPQPGKSLFSKPNPSTAMIAEDYKSKNAINVPVGDKIYALDTDYSKKIADAYENMAHDPTNPEVIEAYEAMADETLKQFDAITERGYVVEIFEGQGEPYANSAAMIDDVRNNNHQYILSTENDFGQTKITEAQRKENPLLRPSGKTDVNGKPLLVNDVFRFVHDFFGHTERGNSFGPVGEENAWDVHARMYSEKARRAMTTETRGQNSWVNFGPHMRTSKSAAEYEKNAVNKALDKFVQLSKDKKFANIADFAKEVFPADVYAKYKSLYDTAKEKKIIVDVSPGSMRNMSVGGIYDSVATWGLGSINIDPSTIYAGIDNWEELAEIINHEIIHGLLSRGLTVSDNSEFKIHSELAPIFQNVVDNFDNASDEVKETISYIIDSSKDYSAIRDFSKDVADNEDYPSTPNLEEFITYAFTNKAFADFLDTIPGITKGKTTKRETLWSQLKDIVRDFIKSIVGPTALDDVNSVLDKYFKVKATAKVEKSGRLLRKNEEGYLGVKERPYAEQKIGLMPEEFSQIRSKEGATEVTIDDKVLAEVVKNNKETQVEADITEDVDRFQKVNESTAPYQHRKNHALQNIIKRLSRRFNVPFQVINDPEQKWAGKYSQGKIFINEAFVNPQTAFHEIAHPFLLMAKNNNSELYNSLKDDLLSSEEGKAELERVKREYPELNEEEQIDEAIVSLAGKYGAEEKPLYKRLWDYVRELLASIGISTSKFNPQMSIENFAELITNPMFVYDLSRAQNLALLDNYYQKAPTAEGRITFNRLVDETIAKLRNDANIPGKNKEETTRKFFSGRQADALSKNREDIQALNDFVTSGLFNLKDINDRFDEFKTEYQKNNGKGNQKKLAQMLNELDDQIQLYNNASPLIDSIFEMFPEEKDNFSDFQYSLKREKRLLEDYKKWGLTAIADLLFPYAKKILTKAKANGKIRTIISDESEKKAMQIAAEAGVTDRDTILDIALKEEIKSSVLVAKQDASWHTSLFGGILTSRDIVAASTGLAVVDEIHKAMKWGKGIQDKFQKLVKEYRGTTVFDTNAKAKEFFQKYMRKAKVWTYVGLGEDGKEKYEYKEHDAFHQEYEWDTFYNAKREFFEKLQIKGYEKGERPPKTDEAAYNQYKAQSDAWFAQNTVQVNNAQGKPARVPAAKYKNLQFAALQGDKLFNELYNTYMLSNDKLGHQGLKYGIIPQDKVKKVITETIKDLPKSTAKGTAEKLRDWTGEKEQVYYAQKINGTERQTVPISMTRMLEEGEVSYNLIDSVSKFATISAKYESMSNLEPHVRILKNFVNNSSGFLDSPRRAVKRTSSGIKALTKMEHELMPVDATNLNKQFNSFLDDAVYGQSFTSETMKLWDAKYTVQKGNGPVETVHGFENVVQTTGLSELDYGGFKWKVPRKVGEYTITMTQKDWNFSLKKASNTLGLANALVSMFVNPVSAVVNVLRGKIETYVEATGGRFFTVGDVRFAEGEYRRQLINSIENIGGGKPSFMNELLIRYDAIQGELQDIDGTRLSPGLANKYFRRKYGFFLQNGGEHLIQSHILIAMMRHQKLKVNGKEEISLYEARKREFAGQLDFANTDWTEEKDREFREMENETNRRLNGNYSKIDKARAQRHWLGSLFMMFRKHIYNGLANRWRKGYVNYETGNYTEGYWRTFMKGALNDLMELAINRKINKASMTADKKYAYRKTAADVAVLALLIFAFKAFDDDDDENEVNDFGALVMRRLVSESGQYTPIGGMDLLKIAKNPLAATKTVEDLVKALQQTVADPTERYERSGPGYSEGELKAVKYWSRVVPGWRQIINTPDPERLLQFYQQNSLGFLKPSAGKKDDDETE